MKQSPARTERKTPRLGFAVLFLFFVLPAAGVSSARGGDLTIVPDEPARETLSASASSNPPATGEPADVTGPKAKQPPPDEAAGTAAKPQERRAKEKGPDDRRTADMKALEPQVDQEQRLMLGSVGLLDPESAARWLHGFITAPPLSCPPAQEARWIDGIIRAVELNHLPLSKEILGLAACIISIESSFSVDPRCVDPASGEDMSDLLRRAERKLREKAGPLMSVPPVPRLYEEYRARYYPRLLACKTEGDVESVAKTIASDLKRNLVALPDFLRKPVCRGIDRLAHVVRTKGSMQLNFNRAREVMRERGEKFTDLQLSDYMYTLVGGIDVGIAALKPMFVQYATHYATPGDLSWLFFVGMDYHYGPFSSRNMMEQIRIRDLSGVDIPLDGDFLLYDDDARPIDRQSKTFKAVMKAFPKIPPEEVLRAFVLEKDPHYVYTPLHRLLVETHRERFGETPFAVIGELWMGRKAQIKHGTKWKTQVYLKKLDRYLNSVPWDRDP
jgi:hypothetical protein